MPLELLGVPKQLFVVEELEEALVELSYVVPPVFRELYHHHDQVELPDGDKVRYNEGADGGGQHPSELGEKWLLQNTANCRSGKFSPSKIVIHFQSRSDILHGHFTVSYHTATNEETSHI